MLRNLKLRTKLPLLIFLTVAITVAGFLGLLTRGGWKDAERVAYTRLNSTLTADRNAVQDWIAQIERDLVVSSTDATVTAALERFTGAYGALGADVTAELQQLYITENPHPAGGRQLYNFADDGSDYSITHRRYHGHFRALLQAHGYSDVFLFDAGGNLVYSVFKRPDFATNLIDGPWAQSGLGEVFRGAVARAGAEEPVVFVDFASYGPLDGAAVGFAGIAITGEDGSLQGVLAVQMPTAQFTPLLSQNAEIAVLVVGPGMMPRNRDDALGQAGQAPLQDASLERALAGEEGRFAGPTASGEAGLSVYAPIDLGTFSWAIAAQMTNAAAFGSISRLLTEAAGIGGVLLVLATVLGFTLSRGITGPVNAVRNGMLGLVRGEYATAMAGTARGDELGDMARSAEELRNTLQQARASQQDNIFRGAGFQASSAPMLMLDEGLRVSYANAAVLAFFDRHAAIFAAHGLFDGTGELAGQAIDRLMPDPDSLRAALQAVETLPTTLFFRLGDTRFSMRVGAVADEQGHTIGTVLEMANATQEFMDRALMVTIDGFLATIKMDRQAKVFEVNGTMAEVLGRPAEDMAGTHATDIFQFDAQLAAERGSVIERLDRGEKVFGLFRLRGADGASHWLQGGFSPVLDTDGQPAMFLFMGSDITADREKLMVAERDQQRLAAAQAHVVESLRVGLTALAEGDLTRELKEGFAEGYDELRVNFNEAAGKLRQAIARVMENAGAIHREVGEIASSADDLSRRTERQATTLEETAAALDQLTSSVRSAAQGAERANQMVSEARGNAEQGGQVVSQAVAAMGQISDSSDQISKIISVIDDIAFQTNLLALNAGVEAARAGEAGRGFAVVASEVRALAQRSSDAAREISGLISSSGDHVKRGVDLVGQTGEALRGIVTSVSDIAGHVSEIAQSAQEQAAGLDEINTAMNQLDQVTQQNAAMFEQTNAASQALSSEADTLKHTVGLFCVGNSAETASARPVPPGARMDKPGAPQARPSGVDAKVRPGSLALDVPVEAAPQDAGPSPTFRSGRRSPAPTEGNAALAVPPEDEDWEEF